ncbi:MAG: DUF3365 domain-containing protein, partial [Magnetococcales bacterium]|nr:DUF3365 domain-containing protein [Magnetococcales bacterium]
MSATLPPRLFFSRLWPPALGWTAMFSLLLAWNVVEERRHTEEVAVFVARAMIQKDIAFRNWAASHGGVYVPIDERTPPNPFLTKVPERDIQTPSGRQLTLMNPAYLLRQLTKYFPDPYGNHEHITSLKPLNPAN